MKKIEKLSLKQIQTEMPVIPGSHLDRIKGGEITAIFDKDIETLTMTDSITGAVMSMEAHCWYLESGVYNVIDNYSEHVYLGSGIGGPDRLEPYTGEEGVYRLAQESNVVGWIYGGGPSVSFSNPGIQPTGGSDPSFLDPIKDFISQYANSSEEDGGFTTLTIVGHYPWDD